MSRTEQEMAAVREALKETQEYAHAVHMAAALAGCVAAGELTGMSKEMQSDALKWLALKAWQAADDLNDVLSDEMESELKKKAVK